MRTLASDIDLAGSLVANEALRLVARHPQFTPEHIDAVVAAMKAATAGIVSRLIDDTPKLGTAAVQVAIFDLAQCGLDVFTERKPS